MRLGGLHELKLFANVDPLLEDGQTPNPEYQATIVLVPTEAKVSRRPAALAMVQEGPEWDEARLEVGMLGRERRGPRGYESKWRPDPASGTNTGRARLDES